MIRNQIVVILITGVMLLPGYTDTAVDKLKKNQRYFQYACVTQSGYDINKGKNGSCLEVEATAAVDPKVLEKVPFIYIKLTDFPSSRELCWNRINKSA